MNLVRLAVDDPDELLAASGYGAGALVRVQSGAASTGPFANVATAALVSKTYEYLVYDQAGTSTTWYQTRYENAGGTVVSAWSSPFQASGGSGYCTLPAARLRIFNDSTVVKDDDLISSFITQASARVESITDRTFYRDPPDGTNGTFLYDGFQASDGGPIVAGGRCLIESRGIVSLTTVEVATFTGDTFRTIPTSDWFLRPSRPTPGWPFTQLWITNVPSSGDTTPGFYPGFATVRLTGVRGWPAIPPDITDVTLSMVVGAYRARAAGGGDRIEIAPDGTRTFERVLSSADLATLHRYSLRELVIV